MKPVIGLKFGYLEIVEDLGMERTKKHRFRKVKAKCLCGEIKSFNLANLVKGNTTSCGCYRKIKASERNGSPRLSKNILYHVWGGMKDRCNNPNSLAHKNYGGRGITICEEWSKDYLAFHVWALNNGWAVGLEIDRINNNLGYCPENCHFIEKKENARNRRSNKMITYNGETKCAMVWANELNISANRIYRGLRKGHSIENIFSGNKKV